MFSALQSEAPEWTPGPEREPLLRVQPVLQHEWERVRRQAVPREQQSGPAPPLRPSLPDVRSWRAPKWQQLAASPTRLLSERHFQGKTYNVCRPQVKKPMLAQL
jgi:hypothetical protein